MVLTSETFTRVFRVKPVGALIAMLLFMTLGGPLVTIVALRRNVFPAPMLVFMWLGTLAADGGLAAHLTYRRVLEVAKIADGIRIVLRRSAMVPLGKVAFELPPAGEVVILPPQGAETFAAFSIAVRGSGYAVQIAAEHEHIPTRLVAGELATFLGASARDCSKAGGLETDGGPAFSALPTPSSWPQAPHACRICSQAAADGVRFELPIEKGDLTVRRMFLMTLLLAVPMWLISWSMFDERIQSQPGITPLKIGAWGTLFAPFAILLISLLNWWQSLRNVQSIFTVTAAGISQALGSAGAPQPATVGRFFPIESVSIRPLQPISQHYWGVSVTGYISIAGKSDAFLGMHLTPMERDWLARAILAAHAGMQPPAERRLSSATANEPSLETIP